MKENKIMERKRIKRGICIVKEGEEESEACGTPLSHYFHFAKHHGPSSCRCSLIHIKRTHDIIRRVSAPVYANSHFAPPQKVVRIPFCLPTPPPEVSFPLRILSYFQLAFIKDTMYLECVLKIFELLGVLLF